MLVKMRWILKVLLALLVLAVFHYNLPQRDIVRITGTEILRKDLSGWTGMFYAAAQSGEAQTQNRDLRLINTVRANGKVSVYRNEDTGFNWPPYFKFDTANLQTEAADLRSTSDNPRWVVIRHYGWRNEFLPIYPNAVDVRRVDSPDVTIIPWTNIIILTLTALVFWASLLGCAEKGWAGIAVVVLVLVYLGMLLEASIRPGMDLFETVERFVRLGQPSAHP